MQGQARALGVADRTVILRAAVFGADYLVGTALFSYLHDPAVATGRMLARSGAGRICQADPVDAGSEAYARTGSTSMSGAFLSARKVTLQAYSRIKLACVFDRFSPGG